MQLGLVPRRDPAYAVTPAGWIQRWELPSPAVSAHGRCGACQARWEAVWCDTPARPLDGCSRECWIVSAGYLRQAEGGYNHDLAKRGRALQGVAVFNALSPHCRGRCLRLQTHLLAGDGNLRPPSLARPARPPKLSYATGRGPPPRRRRRLCRPSVPLAAPARPPKCTG